MERGRIGYLKLLILAPIGIVLALYAYIGSFNRLLGDSFCSYTTAERLGLLRSMWFWRISWSGRYTAYAVDWVTMKLFGAEYVPFFIPVILILWITINVGTVYLLIKPNSISKNNFQLALILGITSVFLILTNSPFIEQSFFWLDGFRAYTLPIMLLPAYLSLYMICSNRIRSKISLIISSMTVFTLFFINGGLSETISIFQFVVLLFLIAYIWIIERPAAFEKNSITLIAGLLGAITSILVIITAPGNHIRQSFFPPPPGIFDLLRISFSGYIIFLNGIIETPEKVLGIIGGVLVSIWAGNAYNTEIKQTGKKVLLFFLGAFLLSFSCFPPGVYGYGEPPPDRVLIISVFAIVVFLMLTGFIAGNALRQKPINTNNAGNLLFITAVLLVTISAWAISSDLYSSRSVYIDFAKKWDAVDALILQAKSEGKKVVNIPDMSNWAALDQPSQNPRHYMTECYSGFYGIQVFGPP